MGKLVNIITVLFFMIAGIDAQGSAFRRFMFMRDRELAFRRAFPFGVPLTFRGTGFPSSFAARMALARRGGFRFGPGPFPFTEFGSRPVTGSPFATGPVFFPGTFEGPRFGTGPSFGTGTFGATGEPTFFPGGSRFPPGSGFPTGGGFGGPMPPTGSGFPSTPDMSTTPGETGRSQTTTESGSGMTTDQSGSTGFSGGPDVSRIPTGGSTDLGTTGSGTTFPGSGAAVPDLTPSPDVGMGASPFPAGFGAPGGFGGFGPMPPTPTSFGPGFGRPMSGPFPGESSGGFPGGRVDSSAPNGRFQGAPGGFRGFGPSDRSGFVPPTAGPMTGDGRFFARGPAFDVTPSFPGRSTFMTPFPGDPRFSSFGQSGRFTAPGPQFTTPGASTDPNLNLRFQPLPGSQPSGQFSGVTGPNQFPPMTPNMRNPPPNTNTINTNNNQIAPSGTGSQAASIDGFGAVSSTNNLNTEPGNMVSNANANSGEIIRFDAGVSASQPEVVVNNAGNQAGGSNEFRVVEVGNILDAPTGSGSITIPSTDRSVVDSMGFQAGGDANMAARDLTASGPQGATFSVESPPPPPIMVPNNNNQQPGSDSSVPSINDLFENTGIVAEEFSGTQTLTFPIVGTENKSKVLTTTNSGNDVTKEYSTQVPEVKTKPAKSKPKTTTTTTQAPLDIANSML